MTILAGDEKAAEREMRVRDIEEREHRCIREGQTAIGRDMSLVEIDDDFVHAQTS